MIDSEQRKHFLMLNVGNAFKYSLSWMNIENGISLNIQYSLKKIQIFRTYFMVKIPFLISWIQIYSQRNWRKSDYLKHIWKLYDDIAEITKKCKINLLIKKRNHLSESSTITRINKWILSFTQKSHTWKNDCMKLALNVQYYYSITLFQIFWKWTKKNFLIKLLDFAKDLTMKLDLYHLPNILQ
jgi:hypothetical protein